MLSCSICIFHVSSWFSSAPAPRHLWPLPSRIKQSGNRAFCRDHPCFLVPFFVFNFFWLSSFDVDVSCSAHQWMHSLLRWPWLHVLRQWGQPFRSIFHSISGPELRVSMPFPFYPALAHTHHTLKCIGWFSDSEEVETSQHFSLQGGWNCSIGHFQGMIALKFQYHGSTWLFWRGVFFVALVTGRPNDQKIFKNLFDTFWNKIQKTFKHI